MRKPKMSKEEREALVKAAAAPKSNQLNSVDLVDGPRIFRITDYDKRDFNGKGEFELAVVLDGDDARPWRPCRTTVRQLNAVYGVDPENWIGKYVELYRDPDVTYGDDRPGGVRILSMEGVPPEGMSLELPAGKSGRKLRLQNHVVKHLPMAEVVKPDGTAGKVPVAVALRVWARWRESPELAAHVERNREVLKRDLPDLYAELVK